MKIQAEMNTEWKITQLGNSVRGLPVEWIRYKTNISDLKIPHQSMKKIDLKYVWTLEQYEKNKFAHYWYGRLVISGQWCRLDLTFKKENVSKQKKETAIQMDTRDIEHQERTRKKLPVLYYSE